MCAGIEIGSDMVTMQIAQNHDGAVVILDQLECFFDLEKEIASTERVSQTSIQELCKSSRDLNRRWNLSGSNSTDSSRPTFCGELKTLISSFPS